MNGFSSTNCNGGTEEEEVRAWSDGCYDLLHFGHANQLRQAKAISTVLVVGVHNDEEICHHKGPPVFREEERYALAKEIRWVDEVVKASPYMPTVATLDEYNCQFVVHGDDISYAADGVTDTYQNYKDNGRYRECQRTVGVSTTDIIGRILAGIYRRNAIKKNLPLVSKYSKPIDPPLPGDYVRHFQEQIFHYTSSPVNVPPPKRAPGTRVVYVSGYFDLFHIGHLRFLQAAAKLGDHLIVGLYGDDEGEHEVDKACKKLLPQKQTIVSVYGRAMTVLAYRMVSEVIIGVPRCFPDDLIERFGINLVVRGRRPASSKKMDSGIDCYALADGVGMFRRIDSGSEVTTETIIDRILANLSIYEQRNMKKNGLATLDGSQRIFDDQAQNGTMKIFSCI